MRVTLILFLKTRWPSLLTYTKSTCNCHVTCHVVCHVNLTQSGDTGDAVRSHLSLLPSTAVKLTQYIASGCFQRSFQIPGWTLVSFQLRTRSRIPAAIRIVSTP